MKGLVGQKVARGESLAVAELPSGGPTDRGLPLDPSIPGTSTYSKPVDDIRSPSNQDDSIHRVDSPNDLTKDQTIPDSIDNSKATPSYNGLGKPDPATKTRYPYRDGVPNAHNASFLAELWKLEGARVATISGTAKVKVASTIDEVMKGLDRRFKERAKTCSAEVKRVDLKNLRWIFSVDCGHGPKAVKIRVLPGGHSRKFSKLDLELSCSCKAWQWLGPEFHAKGEKFLLKPQVGTASTPDVRDPERDNRVCKHVAAALSVAKNWELPKVPVQRAIKKSANIRKALKMASDRQAKVQLWASEALNPSNWEEGLRIDWVASTRVVTAYIRARGEVNGYAEFQLRREGSSWPKLWNRSQDLVGALGRLGVTKNWASVPPKIQNWLQEEI